MAALLETGIIPRRSGHLARVMIDAPQRTVEFAAELECLSHAVNILNYFPDVFKNYLRATSLFSALHVPRIARTIPARHPEGDGLRTVTHLSTSEELAHNGPRPRRPKSGVPRLYGAAGRGLCAFEDHSGLPAAYSRSASSVISMRITSRSSQCSGIAHAP